jgi:hypothetical protein
VRSLLGAVKGCGLPDRAGAADAYRAACSSRGAPGRAAGLAVFTDQRSADAATVHLVSQFGECPRRRCDRPVIPRSTIDRSNQLADLIADSAHPSAIRRAA